MDPKRKYEEVEASGEEELWPLTTEKACIQGNALKLLDRAIEMGIKLPEPMRGIEAKRACAKMTQSKKLMAGDRNGDIKEDCLDVKGALQALVQQYGAAKGSAAAVALEKASQEEEFDDEGNSKKKRKEVKHESRVTKNQALCDVFDELATCYFQISESQKGICFRKVAKIIAEDIKYKITKDKVPTKSGKLKVKGIGESSIAKIQEFLESGHIQVLEDIKSAL
eukprot:130597_1